MNVAELIEILKEEDPMALVVLSRDPEGNGFNECRGFSTDCYDPDGRELGLAELTPELKAKGYTDEDVLEDGVPCVTLWP
jgi:hypothetical protein